MLRLMHISFMEKFNNILGLADMNASGSSSDLNTQKIVQRAQILQGKFILQLDDDS